MKSTMRLAFVACVVFFGALLVGAGTIAQWLREATQVVFSFGF